MLKLLIVLATILAATMGLANDHDGVPQLLVNGDAETGDLTGWADALGNGFVAYDGNAHGGGYTFLGGCNGPNAPRANEILQDVDTTPYLVPIDAGQVTATFSTFGYAASEGSDTDEAGASVEFRDGEGQILAEWDSSLFRPVNMWVSAGFAQQVPAGTRTIRVRLRAWRQSGYCTDGYLDDVVLGLAWPAVGAVEPTVAGLRLTAWPNPCSSGGTEFEFTVPTGSAPRVDIYDLDGRHLRTLAATSAAGQSAHLRWDGCDGAGRRVPAGTYLARLTANGNAASARVLLLH